MNLSLRTRYCCHGKCLFRYSHFQKSNGDLQALEEEVSRALAIPSQFGGDLEALNKKVKSMMERSGNYVTIKEQAKGRPRQETAFLCKVCGKESKVTNIIDHIESDHIEGIAVPCNSVNKFIVQENL